MKNILNQIIENKKKELRYKKSSSNFVRVFSQPNRRSIALIAEIKLASPSGGVMGNAKDISKRAKMYEQAGADAISVVVDRKYFAGDYEFIRQAKKVTSLPILAKDFVIDPYQIYEAKIAGASAVLLIAKILNKETLKRFVKLAFSIGLEPVVEVGNEQELGVALSSETICLGVNARDLVTFKVSIEKACTIGRKIPDSRLFIGFSGVKTRHDVERYKSAGAKAILVGTALMKGDNNKKLIRDLRGTPNQ